MRWLVNRAPVGAVDAAPVYGRRTVGERAGDLDPSVLKPGDLPDKRREFAEILVLAENQSHIKLPTMRRVQGIKGEPHIDSLFFTSQKGMRAILLASRPS
jgi:hypothetical protein